MNIYTGIYILLLIVLITKQLYYQLAIFQQEHYDMLKYSKNVSNFYKSGYSAILSYACLVLIGCYYIWRFNIILVVSSVMVVLSFISIKRLIISLKFTKRIIRLIITYFIILSVLLVIGYYLSIELVTTFALVIVPWLIMLANLINYPIEQMIRTYFIKKAQKKLKNILLFKIGITGSYGKTSTKHILTSLLEDHYLTLATPKSYNTPMGIARTINEYLYENHELFVVEMGAFRRGEIAYLTNFVQPDIGILTDVGPQHLSTFKNIETVLHTKMELFTSKSKPKIAILNFDNALIKNFAISEIKGNMRIIGFGIEEEGVDYQAKNMKISEGLTEFDLYLKGNFSFSIKTQLIGRHNIYNLLAALSVVLEMNLLNYEIPIEKVVEKSEKLINAPHRLSYEKRGSWDVYDDSFNSNIIGFTNALEVLKMSSLIKVVITPGIVDGGNEMKSINEKVAKELIDVADEVYLVINEASRYIEDLFIKEGYRNFSLVDSFIKGYKQIEEKYSKQRISLLIENDLPDNFLRRK